MRRRARECALQILYQLDVGSDSDAPQGPVNIDASAIDVAMDRYWESFKTSPDEERAFAERLVRGVMRERDHLDAAVASVSHHWRVGRMDKVDRSLIRLAAYEILHCPDIPRAASINEAVELAKRFSGAESSAFVNGVLDRLVKEEDESP